MLAERSVEDFSLVNSQIDIHENSAQNINKNNIQNKKNQKEGHKQTELNDILNDSRLQSPAQTQHNNQINYHHFHPQNPSPNHVIHEIIQGFNQTQGNINIKISDFQQAQSELNNQTSSQLMPKFYMDISNSQITPVNSAQHAVFGAAMFQQGQSFLGQNVGGGHDISQQQLISQDQSRIHQLDSTIVSPNATGSFVYDTQGIPYLVQNNVFTPMNTNGNVGFPQANMFSPNNNGSQNDLNIQHYQSQQSLMGQSLNQGQASADKQINASYSKTSKFFNSKLNQVSQMKSIRSKLNTQTFGNIQNQVLVQNPASQEASKFSQKSNTGQEDDKKTKLKEYQNIQDAGESSSTHSKLSNISSQKKQVNHIIFSTKDLSAMKIINLFGLISIGVIISVTLYQYYSMKTTFTDFSQDTDVADWPMRFISNMSLISKAKNFLQLIDLNFFQFTVDEQTQYIKQKNQELIDSFQDELTRLTEIHRALPGQQLFQYFIDNNIESSVSSLFGNNTDLSKVSSNDDGNFKVVDLNVPILYSLVMQHQYLFQYVYGSGIPRGQYVSYINEDKLEVELMNGFLMSQADQISSINGIRSQLSSLMILILTICPLCISIVLPLYSFIQTRRQEILQLFGTFSIQRLDQCIQETRFTSFYVYDPTVEQKALSQKQNIFNKLTNHNTETVKKQTLSSSTPLPKFSFALFFIALLVFCFTLPYPLINQSISNKYMDESQIALQLKCIILQTYPFNFFLLSQLDSQIKQSIFYQSNQNLFFDSKEKLEYKRI